MKIAVLRAWVALLSLLAIPASAQQPAAAEPAPAPAAPAEIVPPETGTKTNVWIRAGDVLRLARQGAGSGRDRRGAGGGRCAGGGPARRALQRPDRCEGEGGAFVTAYATSASSGEAPRPKRWRMR